MANPQKKEKGKKREKGKEKEKQKRKEKSRIKKEDQQETGNPHVDFLLMLPDELALNILVFLASKDLKSYSKARLVSKRWLNMCNDHDILKILKGALKNQHYEKLITSELKANLCNFKQKLLAANKLKDIFHIDFFPSGKFDANNMFVHLLNDVFEYFNKNWKSLDKMLEAQCAFLKALVEIKPEQSPEHVIKSIKNDAHNILRFANTFTFMLKHVNNTSLEDNILVILQARVNKLMQFKQFASERTTHLRLYNIDKVIKKVYRDNKLLTISNYSNIIHKYKAYIYSLLLLLPITYGVYYYMARKTQEQHTDENQNNSLSLGLKFLGTVFAYFTVKAFTLVGVRINHNFRGRNYQQASLSSQTQQTQTRLSQNRHTLMRSPTSSSSRRQNTRSTPTQPPSTSSSLRRRNQ